MTVTTTDAAPTDRAPAALLSKSSSLDALSANPLNWTRYESGQRKGHYESFYQRANHSTRPLAFWIRYTVFQPNHQPDAAIGELWAMFFNGETGKHVAVKEEYPIARCQFDRQRLYARVNESELTAGSMNGTCHSSNNTIAWDLAYDGEEGPLLQLARWYYSSRFAKAKSLVGLPLAEYSGSVTVNDEVYEIDGWVGSQNHNWGSKHTDYYAFGQTAGFDNAPHSFLEVVTAQLKIGPVWTPTLTPLVLRHNGQEYAANTLRGSFANRASFRYFDWEFSAETKDVIIEGSITAPREAFVGLNYYNPPGGIKHCLNSKIADCKVLLTHKSSGMHESLVAKHRTAFEILTDDRSHGIKIRA